MKIDRRDPPRRFAVGHDGAITLHHVLDLWLAPDEQVTIRTDAGGELDVVRKDWGFYATPSLNGRLPQFGLRACLVVSGDRRYVLLVEHGRESAFRAYLREQGMRVLHWLDGDAPLTPPDPEDPS